jgi:hypothetical protein
MPAASYLVGRQQADLRSMLDESDISDLLFAAQRLDGTDIKEQSFEHCTFANVSFKDCIFDRAKFRDCVFVACYFRGTRVQNTSFSTCKFIDCDFTKLDMRTSELKWYNHFKGCWIRRHDVEDNLPSEPNLRHYLCMNLSAEARAAGALRESEWFRQIAAQANELHLSSAFRQKTKYYAEKFKGRLAIAAFLEYCASRFRGYLWGYRRSFLVVLRNWFILTMVAYPLFFLLVSSGLRRPNGSVEWWDAWLASLGSMLPGSGISNLEFVSGAAQAVAFLEVLTALLFGGLTAALIFRSVYEQWR